MMNTTFNINKQIFSIGDRFIKVNGEVYEIPEHVLEKDSLDNSLIIDNVHETFYINGYEFINGKFVLADILPAMFNEFLTAADLMNIIDSL